MYVRQRPRIGIIVGMLVQSLGDYILVEWQFSTAHLLRHLLEMVVNVIHNNFLLIPRQDLIEDVLSGILRLDTPIATHEIQTLCLCPHCKALTTGSLRDGHGSVLLLLEQKHGAKDTINLQLERLVKLVHLPLHRVSQFQHFGILLHIGNSSINHDGIGVAVNHLESNGGLCQVDSTLEGFSAHGGDKGGDGLGVESRVGKS
mmetsp:Transcript_8937/g.20094  ORF Transcript_8937/g.20094 Transcript_8937/m.20094 type:complete len:202 (+) Transcript_8937:1148-1753(+)